MLDPEVEIISNQDPEEEINIMVVVKLLDKVEESRDKIYAPLCGELYKEEYGCLVPRSGTDSYSKMNCFTWSK